MSKQGAQPVTYFRENLQGRGPTQGSDQGAGERVEGGAPTTPQTPASHSSHPPGEVQTSVSQRERNHRK